MLDRAVRGRHLACASAIARKIAMNRIASGLGAALLALASLGPAEAAPTKVKVFVAAMFEIGQYRRPRGRVPALVRALLAEEREAA
jgi:hypothetical protein